MPKKPSKQQLRLDEKIAELRAELPSNDLGARTAVARVENAYDWAREDPKVGFEFISGAVMYAIDPMVKLMVGVAILPPAGRSVSEACGKLQLRLIELRKKTSHLPGAAHESIYKVIDGSNIPTHFNLPSDITNLLGRESDIDRTVSLLTRRKDKPSRWDRSKSAHVAIVGLAGIGKTALAVRVARDFDEEHFGPRVFVRCDKFATLEAFQAELLRLRTPSILEEGEDLGQAVREVLERESFLLILDQLLDLADPSHSSFIEFIDELTNIPSLTLLITSRNHVFVGRSTPRVIHQVQLESLNPDVAEDLFRSEYARGAKHTPLAEDAPELQQLIPLLDGLPVAIVSAARQARETQSLGDVVARWQSRESTLKLKFDNKQIYPPATLTFIRLIAELPAPVLRSRDEHSEAISRAIDTILGQSDVQQEGPPSMKAIKIRGPARDSIVRILPSPDVKSEVFRDLALSYFRAVAGTTKRAEEDDSDNKNFFELIKMTEGDVADDFEPTRLRALLTCPWEHAKSEVQLRNTLQRMDFNNSPSAAYSHLIRYRLEAHKGRYLKITELKEAAEQAAEHELDYLLMDILGNLSNAVFAAGDYIEACVLCKRTSEFYAVNHSSQDLADSHGRHIEVLEARLGIVA
ncbi:hypothetical protein RQP46_011040 [Phenoliferia psychrophenolica]